MSDSRLSRRYAKALFSLGQGDGSLGNYGRELMEFNDFCSANRDFGQVIANPIFSVEERKKLLEVILSRSGFSAMVKNFLNLLLDKNRIGAIKAITDHYGRLTDEASNVVRAEVISARPMKKGALEKIEKSLEKVISKKIISKVSEDRDLIGGIVVKIGDLVLDGSIRAQLDGLKESFKRGE